MQFAAKLLPPITSSDEARRVEWEVQAMRRLKHEHIVSFLGRAACGLDSYILMELLTGGSVRQMLSEAPFQDGLPVGYLRAYSVQLFAGLHYLHGAMVVHRDLKEIIATHSCSPLSHPSLASANVVHSQPPIHPPLPGR